MLQVASHQQSNIKQRKAHLDNFWSEFFEQSAKPRAAIQIFNVAIGWASIRVICFCSTQTLQRLKVLKCIFMWKQGLYERFRLAKMLSDTLCFATVRDPIKNRLIGSHSREPKSKLYGIQKIVAGKVRQNRATQLSRRYPNDLYMRVQPPPGENLVIAVIHLHAYICSWNILYFTWTNCSFNSITCV